ncbi:hypothetical protein O7623_07385 [Solwaraspora sp. WMMD791]|uniref:hypothetical protein n=1 Tax=Solwaraspora sp. WMMD791 TaxID=3016086 RepID=UPI00249CE605|nr:hypothetical protein [Solwaraspora sp. WMMD791]WFE28997.1 hypothetical protein O7623_07385 [Solwaraspora sp. WMMD791]
MSYYLAPSLQVLRTEIDARWPDRDRRSDGWIGDASHASRTSDHNPNSRGAVNAIDVDRDGIDVATLLAAFEAHPAAQYWIFERQIANRSTDWSRRIYSGSNPHTGHVHLSIRQNATAEQDTSSWGLWPVPVPTVPPPAAVPPADPVPAPRPPAHRRPRMVID